MSFNKKKLRISITSSCNMKCSYCHNEGNKGQSSLQIEQIRKILKKCKNIEFDTVRLTGGEPLLVENIENICKMIIEEFNLNVEINTNGIEIEKLLNLIKKGLIKRVVIGLDYFNKEVSKDSPVGQSSEIIKKNILEVKKSSCDVCIDTVYDEDDNNIINLVNWTINNNIPIRILERVTEKVNKSYGEKYMKLQKKIKKNMCLDWHFDDNMKELCGYKKNTLLVQFYHSMCRMKLCDLCRKELFRVTSNGVLKICLFSDKEDLKLI